MNTVTRGITMPRICIDCGCALEGDCVISTTPDRKQYARHVECYIVACRRVTERCNELGLVITSSANVLEPAEVAS